MFYLPGFHLSSVTQSLQMGLLSVQNGGVIQNTFIVREYSFSDFVQRNVPGTFRGGRGLFLDVSVKIEIIDFLQPKIKQKLQENIITEPEKYVSIDYVQS